MNAKVPALFDMLHALVAAPSVSCSVPQLDMSNRAVIDLLAGWLDALGFAVQILPLANNASKANLIATLGSGTGGLVLAGHTDTVPYDDNKWSSDPFKLVERDRRWYGLGATDMKGFFPVAIEAVKAFVDAELKQPLIILATADEESSMDGARQLVESAQLQARFAVIGEPTDLKPARLHKGIMMEAITITGRSGHSSNPSLGNNALEAMQAAMQLLLNFRDELQARYRNPAFQVAVPTLNLGCIHGGDSPNRICGECELHFDLRPLPGMHIDELRTSIRQRLQPLAEQRRINIQLRSLFPGVQAFEQTADSPLVKSIEELSGHSAQTAGFATEAPFMQQLGMDTVVFGPGSINQAHQPDEYVEITQLQPAIAIIQALIRKFCL
ncbi:MAG TPA: acetylornithine deacetylase, partial [Spongiibacteraceae bacterium]